MPCRRLWSLWPVMLLVTALSGRAQEIYKSVDEEGKILFTNDPAMANQGEVVSVPPLPDANQVEEALKREERLRETGDRMQQERSLREAQRAEAAARQRRELADAERDRQILEKLDQLSQPRGYYYPPAYQRPWPPGHPPVNPPRPPIATPLPSLKPAPR